MSFHYAVDLPLAHSVIEDLTAVESSLTDVVVDLRWRIAHLHTGWLGAASAAHVVAHAEWEASFREMHASLVEMRTAVASAAHAYAAAASAGVEMWSSVR